MTAADLMTDLNTALTKVRAEYDSEIASIKKDYESTITALKDSLMAAQTESALAKDALTISRNSELLAHRTMASLLAHFGTVAKVFESAKTVAEQAGTMIEQTTKTVVTEAEQKVQEAADSIHTSTLVSDTESVAGKIEEGIAALLHKTPAPAPVSPVNHQ